MNNAPQRNPSVATKNAGILPAASARSMAGCKSDQKLAAIITPAAKPSIKLRILGFGDLNSTTVAAPSAVTSHVPSVANNA